MKFPLCFKKWEGKYMQKAPSMAISLIILAIAFISICSADNAPNEKQGMAMLQGRRAFEYSKSALYKPDIDIAREAGIA